jgi:hypothetical protein
MLESPARIKPIHQQRVWGLCNGVDDRQVLTFSFEFEQRFCRDPPVEPQDVGHSYALGCCRSACGFNSPRACAAMRDQQSIERETPVRRNRPFWRLEQSHCPQCPYCPRGDTYIPRVNGALILVKEGLSWRAQKLHRQTARTSSSCLVGRGWLLGGIER